MLATPRSRSKANITPERARGELARRKLAKLDLFQFSQYVDPRFQRYAHQVYLAEKLMQVKQFIETKGSQGIGRLIIMMPPQHGKSELASIKAPAWILGNLPDTRVILTSYGADLATRNSRSMRDLVNSSKYQAVFGLASAQEAPVMLSSDSRSSSSWDLAQPHRGGVLAAGVGGAITGFGGDLLVIDDPLKNREEAENEGRRDLVDDWFRSSAITRLSPWGAIILFLTRWHSEDLAGKMIKRMISDPRADQWEIVCLPALALGDYPTYEKQREMMRDGVYLPTSDPLGRSQGEALLPEKYDRRWLENRKVNMGPYDFEALYQQMPYLREGGMFKRDYFTIVDSGPGKDALARVMCWDKAGTEGGGKRTSGVLMSKGRDGFYYVEHVSKGQWSTYQRETEMIKIGRQLYNQYGPFPIKHPQDPGSAGLDSARVTNINMAEAGLEAHFEPVTGDKEVRAGPLSSVAEGGRVRLVKGGWNEEFVDEYVAFPKGAFKDQVDSGSDAFNTIIEMVNEPEDIDEIVTYEERVRISPM